MNGRVYDYRLGRFLSLDPIISDPANSQSINPYSYIGNNPLSGTDPTGYEGYSLEEYSLEDHDCRYAQCQVIAVNSRPEQHDQKQGALQTSGATPQSTTTTCSNPSTCGGPEDTNKQQDPAKNESYVDKATRLAKGTLLGASTLVLKVGGQFSMALGLEAEQGYQSTMAQWNASLEGQPHEALAAGERAAEMALILLTAKGIGEAVPRAQVPSGIELLYAGSKKAPLPTESLRTPTVTDPNLASLVRDLYKGARGPNPIGTGSTADAVRNEQMTGLATGGKFHSQKAAEYSRALERWLAKNPNAAHHDRLVAESLRQDLQSALRGK